ncbi:MAG: hypothetical protein ACJA2W_002216 [Planctomycetota bacterium]|jgi:hypothetical protein
MPSIRLFLLTGILVAAASSCSSGPIGSAKPLDLDEVSAAIEAAAATDLAQSNDRDLAKAVGSMLSVLKTPLIETDQRATAQSLLERGAEALAERSQNPEDLEDLALSDLPARIAVPAGLRSARLLLEDDERSEAYRLIQRIDQRYPSHALREEAGDLLWDIGNSYANDKRRRLFLFPYSNRAPGVFEYLSTEFPTHEKSDEALVMLAEIYSADRLFDLAIDKYRELVLWSPGSPYRISSEAEIPRLRLADLDGPAYDRSAMLLAMRELEAWIADYGQHKLRPDVDRTLVDCLQRLADNDLIVAKFYRTVKSPEGARQHAARALAFGKRAGNAEQQEEIRTFLASVDEIERVKAPIILDGSINDEFRSDSGLGIAGPAGLSDSAPDRSSRSDPRGDPDEPEGNQGEGGNQ